MRRPNPTLWSLPLAAALIAGCDANPDGPRLPPPTPGAAGAAGAESDAEPPKKPRGEQADSPSSDM